jgi:hypothetical protein
MLKDKNIPNRLWDEFVSPTTYLQNIIPAKYLEHKTPYIEFSGYKVLVNHLRDFGSKEFSHIPKENIRKFDANLFNIVMTISLTKCMILLLINYF